MSPIRSNRGRQAVWRSIWAWPLHTRARALTTLLVVVILLLAVGRIVSFSQDQPETAATPPPPASTSQPHASVPAPSTTNNTDPVPAPTGPIAAMGPPAPQEALRTAAGFLRNWVHHPKGMTSTKWAENLGPYAMPETVGQFYSTEPANVPASRLIGDPQVTRVTDAVVELDWRTDGARVHLVLIHPSGPWQVNRIGEAT